MRISGLLIITASFMVAIMLSMMPMPSWALCCRPAWVPLVLIYWVIALPERVNLGVAWFVGILLDSLNDTLLGEHALALVLVTYFAAKFYRQIRVFPIWQQAFCVMILIILYQSLLFWVQGVVGQPIGTILFWLPAATSLLLWPWVFSVLRGWRRHFKIQ